MALANDMGGINSTSSPLDAVAGTDMPRAIDVFTMVGDETRLSIMLALWEEYEPWAGDNTVPFSELRDRVGRPDSGQFNYHLNKLDGHFVRKTDAGYELRRAGQQLVRTVIAGAGIDTPSVETTELAMDCVYCGAPTAIVYRDQWLYTVCTECEGCLGEQYDLPEGTLSGAPLDPAGLTDRSPEEMYQAAWVPGVQSFQAACEGVCDTCSGPIERSLHICDDHASEGVCTTCGRRPALMAHFRCPVCKDHHSAPPYKIVAQHPAVIAFYYERGISLQYEVDDFERLRRRENLIAEHDQELVSENPIRVRVEVRHEGDELSLMLDEEMNVIDVSEKD